MTIAEIIEIVIGSGGVLGITFLIFRMGRIVERIDTMASSIVLLDKKIEGKVDALEKKVEEKFDVFEKKIEGKFDVLEKKIESKLDIFEKKVEARFDKIDIRFDKIENGIRSIDIRLSVLEAETIIYNTIADPNARSEAAKNRWKKKRARQIEYASSGKLME